MATSNNILDKSDDLASRFDFVCCWTCKNCIYELDKRSHECTRTGLELKGVHAPTKCEKWIQG